jgi:bacterioferritin (cytochrome b1)
MPVTSHKTDFRPPRSRSRRDFLRVAGLTTAGASAALATACGGGGGSGSPGGGGSGEDDVILLNHALDLEYTAVAAYTAGAELLRGSLLTLGRQFRDQEREHAQGLAKAIQGLGGTPQRPKSASEYERGFPRLRDRSDVLTFAIDLENKAVASYMDTIPKLSSGQLRQTAAAILASEAEHIATLVGARTGNDPARQVPYAFVTGRSA